MGILCFYQWLGYHCLVECVPPCSHELLCPHVVLNHFCGPAVAPTNKWAPCGFNHLEGAHCCFHYLNGLHFEVAEVSCKTCDLINYFIV